MGKAIAKALRQKLFLYLIGQRQRHTLRSQSMTSIHAKGQVSRNAKTY